MWVQTAQPSPAVVRASLAGVHVSCVCVCVCLMGLSQASLLVLLAQIELQSPPRRRPHSSAVSLFLPCVRPTVPLGPVVSDL